MPINVLALRKNYGEYMLRIIMPSFWEGKQQGRDFQKDISLLRGSHHE